MKKSKRPVSPRISPRRRLSNLAIEPMEERMMLTASPGFVAGFATHANGTVDTTATIKLLNATGTTTIATTTPGSDGYYQFNNVTPGNYEVVEVESGYTTSSVSASTIVNPATAINNGTAFAVTVVDPTTQTYTLSRNADPYSDLTAGYTVPNDPFNDANGDLVGQFNLSVTGNLGNLTTDLGICSDDYHGITPTASFSVNPSLTPVAPGSTSAAAIGAIGYLYDHYGTTVQTPINGAAFQLAVWAELYNSPASLTGPNFIVNSVTPAAVVSQANAYIAQASGKSEDAYFLNMTPAELANIDGGQSMLGTDLLNFTNAPTGSFGGFVFVDSGNTGLRATGTSGGSASPGVPNVTVVATTTVNGVTTIAGTTTTAADGSYSFANLPPGTYSVSVVQPAGYLPGQDSVNGTVIPNSLGSTTIGSIVITSGSNTPNVNFAELTPGTISGTVYNDVTGNGLNPTTNAAPAGDTVEAGVTVKLTNSTGTVVATTTSSSTGTYSFTGLTPGTYTVSEVAPTGQVETGPGSVTYSATTTYGSTTPNENFSNYTDCVLSGVSNIYYSVTTNGVTKTFTTLRGNTSPGSIVTAFVTLAPGASDMFSLAEYSAPAATYSSATASQQVLIGDQTATFTNTGTTPATYSLTVTNPNSYYQVDFVCGTPITTFNGGTVTYSSEGRLIDADNEGTTPYVADTLSGTVFVDNSGTGSLTSTDTTLGGVTVTLSGTTNTGVAISGVTTTTAANGTYSFPGIAPGTYKVTALPAGYINEAGNVGSGGGTSTIGMVSSIVVNSNANLTGYNFGEGLPSTISGTVYNDVTGNGLNATTNAAPVGDTVEAGVTVKLTNSAGTVVATTTTASNGTYSFGVLPGTYTVSEVAPTGQIQSGPAGLTYSVTAVAGSNTPNENFSNYAQCVLTGVTNIYYTVTTNGVTTTVTNLRGNTAPGSIVTAYVTLAPGASDMFTLAEYQAPSSGYVAATASQQVLVGYQTATFTNSTSAPVTYSETVTNPNSYFQVDFACGQAITTLNGNVVNYNGENRLISADNGGSTAYAADTLSGIVFLDYSANTVYNTNDTGVAGVTVTLTGTSNLGVPVTATTTTGTNGTYTFSGIAPGTYKVVSLPPAYINENGSVGSGGGTSSTGTVSSIVVNSNANLTNYNFGELFFGSINGTVYNDVTGNGLTSTGSAPAGDTTESGVTVNLLNSAGTVVATTTTAANGTYSFGNLVPGTYTVSEVAPSGQVQTGPASLTYATTTWYGSTATDNFANMALCSATGVAGYYYGVTTNGSTKYVSNLRGATSPGSVVTAYIILNPGGSGTFSLADYSAPSSSYNAATAYQQVLVGYQTATFTNNTSGQVTYSETVTNPNSYFQVDFACGQAITTLNGNVVNYNGENRLISADNGGCYVANSCLPTVLSYHNDIGSVSVPGGEAYNNGVYTVTGSGADIWGTADAENYVYQTLNGDGELVVRVTSLSYTDPWAKAGIQIRQSLDASSAQASIFTTPGNGVAFQDRESYGANSNNWQVSSPTGWGGWGGSGGSSGNSSSTPVYLKLVRTGTTITGFESSNGINWTTVGTDTINLSQQVYIGLAVTAHNNSAVATATFDDVSSTGYWSSCAGQNLIQSFGGCSTSTTLSYMLAACYPNLYGCNAGSNNLTGLTNSGVAAFCQSLEAQFGPESLECQTLAVALDEYATNWSCGGQWSKNAGFDVCSTGILGETMCFSDSAGAFGGSGCTTQSVWQLLSTENNQAVGGILYAGNTAKRAEACSLMTSINTACYNGWN